MEQTNPPSTSSPLLQQAIRLKAESKTVKIERSEVSAQVMDALLILENEIAKYEKKQQDKIERKMKAKQNGISK